MDNTIRHHGIIDHFEGDTVFVRINQQSACVGCHARSVCTASDSKIKMIEIKDQSGLYQENEEVTICGRSSLGLQAVFLAFVIPLIVLIGAIVIAQAVGVEETLSGLIGMVLLIPYYYILYLMREKLKRRFVFTLEKHK